MKKKSKAKSVVRRESLHRLLLIDRELSGKRVPVSTRQLAEELLRDQGRKAGSNKKFESFMRAIQRDLKFLHDDLMAPIRYDKEKKGWLYTRDDFFISSTAFIDRLLKIDRKIGNKEYPNLKELTDCFGVSETTIKKDFRFLSSVRTVEPLAEEDIIKFDRTQGGYYYTVSNFRVPHIEKLTNYKSNELRDLVSRELIGNEEN